VEGKAQLKAAGGEWSMSIRELGHDFRPVKHCVTEHETPFGTKQQFLYCHFIFG
jgi:hypothetical protein